MNERDFSVALASAVKAGSQGLSMPRFGGTAVDRSFSRGQLITLNQSYDSARNAHAGKTRSTRRK